MSTPRQIEQRALQRFIRARAGDFGGEEQRELDVWLAEDERHRAEYQRLEALWTALDGLGGRRDELRPRRRWPVAAVAVFAVATLVLAVWLARPVEEAPVTVHRYETARAERRQVQLADATTIMLNADSVLELIDGVSPRLTLLRGDVYISVGRAKGLEVRVGDTQIRDIGTRFAVSTAARGGSVDVAEGLVELRSGAARLTVAAGHRVSFDGEGHFREQRLAGDEMALWRNGRWRFAATPLSRLVDEMSRQADIRVELADPALANLTVSGTFRFDEAERLLWAVAEVHGLKVMRVDARRFRLQRPG